MRYLACNHIPTGEMQPSQPWLFQPETELPEHIRTDKKARQEWIQSPHTKWNYWTFHVGVNKAQRVSKQNYPNLSHGFAVDHRGRVWATDQRGHQVFAWSSDGELLLTLGRRGEAVLGGGWK